MIFFVSGSKKEVIALNKNERALNKLKAVVDKDVYAIWEEFGTGEYALHGDGRKGGWFYEDEKGVGHFTHGKQPKRPLHNAFVSKKGTCERIIKDKIGDL